jgi:1-acyl-sn-glycerol-3-phosphate acyltransferase
MRPISAVIRPIFDFSITITLWFYYIAGFCFFFSPFYLLASFFPSRREAIFQKLNCLHHRLFFRLLRILVPRVKWRISADVSAIRSSIIIANHLSFLDPILFVSLFEKQKTIVKSVYFKIPVFGWILKNSGYISPLRETRFAHNTIDQIRNLSEYLSGGGNLFVFPEGTRSRNARIGSIDKGAFRLARLCGAPIRVVVIRNTGKLYPPDRFLFNTHMHDSIDLTLAGSLEARHDSKSDSVPSLIKKAKIMMEQEVNP